MNPMQSRATTPSLTSPSHTAPYGFVPLSEHVFFPPWSKSVSSDMPLKGAVCGTLDIELTAESPLFIRGVGDAGRFFTRPDGSFAIPGSTVRGLLRNVVEIASFGRMSRVNDKTYGVRDMHNQELYLRHMARLLPGRNGENVPTPLVSAGWLRRCDGVDLSQGQDDDVVAEIEPCSFAKVEYGLLQSLKPGFRPGDKQTGPDKYRQWGPNLSVNVTTQLLRSPSTFPAELAFLRRAHEARSFGEFGKVLSLTGPTPATLVFTGQPSSWRPDAGPKRKGAGNAKHHDFVFYGLPNARRHLVTRKQLRDFEFIHADSGQQGNLERSVMPNAEWRQWRKGFREGGAEGRVPVFFLLSPRDDRPGESELRAFGLAMMFRLAYDRSTRDLVKIRQQEAHGPKRHDADLAEAMFGYVRDDRRDEGQALKGRLCVGTFVAKPGVREEAEVRVVLGSPKASYYPNYIEQGAPNALPGGPPSSDRGKPIYRTYMKPERGAPESVIRGWKRYRPLDQTVTPPPPTDGRGQPIDTSRTESRFRPLARGAAFRGLISVHNLLPAELGALLWAIDFGGDTSCLHRVGLAKSLGYGNARMKLVGGELRGMDWNVLDLETARRDAVRAFEDTMKAWCQSQRIRGGWVDSEQVTEFKALARVIPAPQGRHMRIDNGSPEPRFKNDFALAKSNGTALPSATDWNAWDRRVPKGTADAPRGTSPRSDLGSPRAGQPPSRGSASPGASVPTATAPPPVDIGDGRLRAAHSAGNWVQAGAILNEWRAEAGEHLAARKAFAKSLFWPKAFKRDFPDLVAWFGG